MGLGRLLALQIFYESPETGMWEGEVIPALTVNDVPDPVRVLQRLYSIKMAAATFLIPHNWGPQT